MQSFLATVRREVVKSIRNFAYTFVIENLLKASFNILINMLIICIPLDVKK
jgi:hypothetical protein